MQNVVKLESFRRQNKNSCRLPRNTPDQLTLEAIDREVDYYMESIREMDRDTRSRLLRKLKIHGYV